MFSFFPESTDPTKREETDADPAAGSDKAHGPGASSAEPTDSAIDETFAAGPSLDAFTSNPASRPLNTGGPNPSSSGTAARTKPSPADTASKDADDADELTFRPGLPPPPMSRPMMNSSGSMDDPGALHRPRRPSSSASTQPRPDRPARPRWLDDEPEAPASSGGSTGGGSLLAVLGIMMLALAVRLLFAVPFFWQAPSTVHHIDETILPYEAVAMWEGVTPRELGWPASTTRLMLSAVYAGDFAWQACTGEIDMALSPAGLMTAAAGYAERAAADQGRLIIIGRWFMALLGVVQVGLMYWAARQWAGQTAAVIAALMAALAPVAISHSQFVLADMTGVVLLTILVGLFGKMQRGQAVSAATVGVIGGLAIATKFSFGLWIIPAAWYLVYNRPDGRSTAAWLASRWGLGAVAGVASLVLALPWVWTNPMLIAKETLGVALLNADGSQLRDTSILGSMRSVFTLAGAWVLGSAAVGLIVFPLMSRLRAVGILLVVAAGVGLLVQAQLVFDRYSLLVFPALVIIGAVVTAAGWTHGRSYVRWPTRMTTAALFVLTIAQVWTHQQWVGRVDGPTMAYEWLMSRAEDGDRIAVHGLHQHTPLPLTADCINDRLAAYTATDAYAVKSRLVGLDAEVRDKMAEDGSPRARITVADAGGKSDTTGGEAMWTPIEPAAAAMLNDEQYQAYWLRRMLRQATIDEARKQRGVALTGDPRRFDVTRYDPQPRFGMQRTADVIEQFLIGLENPAYGYDYLVLIDPVESIGVEPTVEFKTGRGQRVRIYARHALTSGGTTVASTPATR